MKRPIYSHPWLIVLVMAVMVLALSACERQLPREDVVDAPATAVPQPPIEVPTPLPPAPETPVNEPDPTPVDTEPGDEQPPPGEEAPPVVPTDPGTTVTQPPPGATGPVTYIVQTGDTLGRIAQQYNVTVNDIATANNLTNIHRLDVGQTLIIPVDGVTTPPQTGGTVHIVQLGENLFRIGQRYGFTAAQLAQYNGIDNEHRIYVGQEIRIPPSN